MATAEQRDVVANGDRVLVADPLAATIPDAEPG
jgi:hypothetical protein